MSNNVIAVAKGNAPVITTVTGAGISGALKYLELFNSFAGLVGVLMMAFGSYWMYRKNRSESLKADAETERIKLENEQKRIAIHDQQVQLEAREIENHLDKTAIRLMDRLAERIEWTRK